MAAPAAAKLALARAVGTLSRVTGGGATSAPGKVLLRLDPTAIGSLASRLPRGSVMVSATNGKTTTATMLAGILERHRVGVVHNAAGANMAGGIASALLAAAQPRGAIAGELGVFEVDEFWLADLVAAVHPRVIVLCNLFRDQLDRYGELDTIAERWAATVSEGPGADARLVLDADDPVVADLGRDRPRVLYFGVADDSLALPQLAHAADAKHCRRCGAPYVFDAVYLGHLGRYHCNSCGQMRPTPEVFASDVTLNGINDSRFTLHTPAGAAAVDLPLPGLYNVYNAVAAAAAAVAMEVPLATIAAGLSDTRAAFGRAQTVTVEGREVRILLVKNPAGANEVLRTLALQPGDHDLLGVLNDEIADGRDVSWIWDADFELLATRIRRVTCSGTRAPELALRMKYAGVPTDRIVVVPELTAALSQALAHRGPRDARGTRDTGATGRDDGDGGDGATGGARGRTDAATLYVLPTYTAMRALDRLLAGRRHSLGRAA